MVNVAQCPVSWGVELPDDPTNPPWETYLDEAAAAGYGGVELGPVGYLPTDSEALAHCRFIPWLSRFTAPRRLAYAMPMRSLVEQTALDRCLRGEPAPVPGGVMQAMAPVNCRARVALSGTLQTIRCVTAQPTDGAPPASLDRPCRHAPTASTPAACG